ARAGAGQRQRAGRDVSPTPRGRQMTLHSPGFEKALRRGVRRAVRSSPALKREFRIANRNCRQISARLFGRTAISVALAFVVWQMADRTQYAFSSLAVISLWTFAFIFVHAQALWSRLFRATDLPALSLLPITDGTVFRWELQKF